MFTSKKVLISIEFRLSRRALRPIGLFLKSIDKTLKTEDLNKIIFSSTTGPISTKLCTKHSWVKWIHLCLNTEPRSLPRRDNNEIANTRFFVWPGGKPKNERWIVNIRLKITKILCFCYHDKQLIKWIPYF